MFSSVKLTKCIILSNPAKEKIFILLCLCIKIYQKYLYYLSLKVNLLMDNSGFFFLFCF